MKSGEAQMGAWMTSALVVGSMIGAGIFMLPVALAPLGANAMIGWVISSAGALCIAFALARLSRLSGDGIQANIERSLGQLPAFLASWAFWVSNWVSQAALAIAGASALSWVNPSLGGADFVIPAAIGSVLLFTAVNALGVRSAGGMQIVTVAIKLLPLAAVILALAIRGGGTGSFEALPAVPLGFGSIATAVALTFFALLGFENATAPVDKVRNPERTIPRAIMGGTLFVALLYLFASTGVQLLLPAEVAVTSSAPIAEVVSAQWGDGFGTLAGLAVAVAAFGALNGAILVSGELGYSMALRRELPTAMIVTRADKTPVVAQLVASALSMLLILANANQATAGLFSFLILLTTASVLVVYLAGAVAAWRLSPSPLARAALAGAFLFIAFAFYGAGLEADLWCLALLSIGLVVRAMMQRAIPPAALAVGV